MSTYPWFSIPRYDDVKKIGIDRDCYKERRFPYSNDLVKIWNRYTFIHFCICRMEKENTGLQVEYTTKEYWDQRYAEDNDVYEWVMDYESLKVFDIERFVKTSDSILVPGCGNSNLTRDMYTDGYHSITAIDISDVVIQKNRKRDRDIPLIRYEVMDCFNMTFPDSTFDVAIDKSTLDTFLCSEELFNKIPSYLDGIARVLKENGTFLVLSFNPPETVWNLG